ncbi:MAG: AEC family transporter [Rhodospirillales bacterium]|nr:AEC family transporter [Rhodospirillales bacterium]
MLAVVVALIPVFVLIVLGYAMRRLEFVPEAFWPPAEKLTYYVTFPALLVQNLAEADVAGLPVLPLAGVEATATVLSGLALLLAWRWLDVSGPAFTSMIQGAIRPNTYVGLAAAASLYGARGVTLMAICVAAVVPLVNLLSVVAMVRLASGHASGWRAMVLPVAKNPLILACLAGIFLNLAGIGLPLWASQTLRILGSAALPIGLLAVGAGLHLRALRRTGSHVLLTSACKLLLLPLLAVAGAAWVGLDGMARGVALLYAALPCSASAYVLARQMGGDAGLMANIISTQTLLAAITIPLLLIGFP